MSYDDYTLRKIWFNTTIPKFNSISKTCYDHNIVGIDEQGHEIYFAYYDVRTSAFGWHVDHRTPLMFGGKDIFANWRAMQWRWNVTSGSILGNLIRKGF